MDYISRNIEKQVKDRFFSGKAIILYGPRQCGKTTLLRHLVAGDETLWLNGDSSDVRFELETITPAKWNALLGRRKVVVLDEAQRISNAGLALKMLVDERPDVQVVATGSSSFELAQKASEPLTGRKFEYLMLPFSFGELTAHFGLLEEKRRLEERLLYGSYPEIVLHPGDERERLANLASSYLYRDVLALESVKRPALIEKLVRALALQVGSEVSVTELSRLTGAAAQTVEKYLGILEQAFVIFSLKAFSRNARTELRKGRKIYFCDLGIRNAVLGNFAPLGGRSDVGALWENYLVLERLKLHSTPALAPKSYFWRNTAQSEVDYIEEDGGALSAWEFKWNPRASVKIPLAFRRAYPEAQTTTVTPQNYADFLRLDPNT